MAKNNNLTFQIIIAMFAGIIVGIALKFLPNSFAQETHFITNLLMLGGNVFISLMKLLVVPSVLVSIVCGVCSLEKVSTIGNMGFKSFKWFMVTTIIAIFIALVITHFFQIGIDLHLTASANFQAEAMPSLWNLINDIIPSNIVKAMVDANMLQVIVFALLLGISINTAGEAGHRIAAFFVDFNVILMRFIMVLMRVAPYGTFCLIAVLFVNQGFDLILSILNYFLTVIAVLFIHTIVTYSIILRVHGFSIKRFFQKIYAVMLFAFGVSSSTASIPLALNIAERKLGVAHSIASFVIPLGININKNGTAIMQAVAAVFIAHAYHVNIGIVGGLILMFMIVLGSIGTAGVPGVGIITLAMILKQLGIPTEGIALILGVDRLLDMLRTTVNVAGNMMVTCLVGKAENKLDYEVYVKK